VEVLGILWKSIRLIIQDWLDKVFSKKRINREYLIVGLYFISSVILFDLNNFLRFHKNPKSPSVPPKSENYFRVPIEKLIKK